MKDDKQHPYAEAMFKFHGEVIEVKDIFGETIRGTCIAIFKPHLNVILETKDSIIIIKNPQLIRRDKETKPKKK